MRLSEMQSAADLEVECTARALAVLREHVDPDVLTEHGRAVFTAGVAAGVRVALQLLSEDAAP